MKRSQYFFVFILLVGGCMYFPIKATARTKSTDFELIRYFHEVKASYLSYNSYQIALTKSLTAANSPISTVPNEFLEYSKIILMTTLSAVCYGITHDLITTHINFDYFASDRTHHGPYTRVHFPYIYKSQNKILYALLWGTIATWWVGLPLGLVWAVAGRCGDDKQKLNWKDLISLDSILMGSMLLTSLSIGIGDYLSNHDSFKMVATMHETSYLAGILAGIVTSIYTYNVRKPITAAKSVFHLEPTGIRINLANLVLKKQTKPTH